MAINGIGGYNNFYSSIYSGLYSNNNKKYNYSNPADLQSLMKLADEVRSPAFAKKMKETYGSDSKNTTSSGEIGTVESEANLSKTALDLKSSAAALHDISKTEIADDDTLFKKVSDFADKYNAVIDAMGKSDSVDALRAGLDMTNTLKTYSGALRRMGISIGSDNKLTVNENTLKLADKNSVASILTNNFSPVSRIADKAETVSKAAANKARTTAFRNMAYGTGSTGSTSFNPYNYSAYSGYNSYASSFIGNLFNSLG